MGMYFINDDYPLQKNSYQYADIKEAIMLRDKLNDVINKYSQSDIDEANRQLMEDVYSEQTPEVEESGEFRLMVRFSIVKDHEE